MINIADFPINSSKGVFVIAELSANHNQSLEIAINSIKAVKKCGADAIKFQTYTPDTITLDCDNKYFQITQGTIWDGITLYELYKKAYTPWEWHEKLFRVAKDEGLICFSSPFDKTAVDFLTRLNVPAYKIASYEINDIPLIKYSASKGKPIIISTGIAELADIELAVNTCREAGNNQIILLKCTSSYPAPIEEANLLTIPNMMKTFDVEVGLSDHSMGITVPIVAVALGACVIEKHFILDRSIGGPDASFSLNPEEFTFLVKSVREAEKALGSITYNLSEKSVAARHHSRSLFVVKDMNEGEPFTEDNMRSIRPGYGLHTKYYNEILGKTAAKKIEKGTPLTWQLII
jgi:pseudaminic acid synthase